MSWFDTVKSTAARAVGLTPTLPDVPTDAPEPPSTDELRAILDDVAEQSKSPMQRAIESLAAERGVSVETASRWLSIARLDPALAPKARYAAVCQIISDIGPTSLIPELQLSERVYPLAARVADLVRDPRTYRQRIEAIHAAEREQAEREERAETAAALQRQIEARAAEERQRQEALERDRIEREERAPSRSGEALRLQWERRQAERREQIERGEKILESTTLGELEQQAGAPFAAQPPTHSASHRGAVREVPSSFGRVVVRDSYETVESE